MSPLVWDLAHIGNQEELWLLRAVGGREAMRPEIDGLYDAFEHSRAVGPHCRCWHPRRRGRTPPTYAAGRWTSSAALRCTAGAARWSGRASPSAWSPSTNSSTTRRC